MRFDPIDRQSATPVRSPQAVLDKGIASDELAVIEMALKDGPRSAGTELLGTRLARLLFGISVPRPLANERLEAIRKFAVAAWFSSEVPESRIMALHEAGVSRDDAGRMLAYVAGRRRAYPKADLHSLV